MKVECRMIPEKVRNMNMKTTLTPHNQQVHESAVIKNFYGTVTQFLDEITREEDGQGNKEDIDKQNDPAWQVPHIGKIHQIVAAV